MIIRRHDKLIKDISEKSHHYLFHTLYKRYRLRHTNGKKEDKKNEKSIRDTLGDVVTILIYGRSVKIAQVNFRMQGNRPYS